MKDQANQYNQAIELLRARPMTRGELAKALDTPEPNARAIVTVLKEHRLVDAPIGRRKHPGHVSLTPLGRDFNGWIPRLNTEQQRRARRKPAPRTEKGGIVNCAKRLPNSVFALGAM